MKEEILQPPEPHPVPPILTPSPPSAFPTVTNVRPDNDRYHPKPVIHVLATAQVSRSYGDVKLCQSLLHHSLINRLTVPPIIWNGLIFTLVNNKTCMDCADLCEYPLQL